MMDNHRAQYVLLKDNLFNKECTSYTTEPAQAINNSNRMLISGKLMIPGQLKNCALENICSGTDYKKPMKGDRTEGLATCEVVNS
uniref:Uncharacterized protein n=1 Tax=Amphimedon queenslandica TaxID=400682 RepID=A0A1X7TY43_AMPQE